MKEYHSSPSADLNSKLTSLGEEALKNNEYKPNKDDQSVKVTFGPNQPLSVEIETKLTQFVASLVNPLRKELGLEQLTINQGSLDFAQSVSQQYEKDNWNMWEKGWHDTKGINEVASNFGLQHGPFKDYLNQMYEDLSSGNDSAGTVETTLNELKDRVYGSTISMLFADGDSTNPTNGWGHAFSLSGLMYDGFGENNESLGVMIDDMGQIHYLIVPSTATDSSTTNAVDNGKYATEMNNKVEIPDQFALLTNQKNNLTKKLELVNNSLQSAKTDQATKQKANDVSQAALTAANQVLTVAQNNVNAKTNAVKTTNDNLTKAQNELAQLQSQLRADQASQKQAQADVDSFATDIATKQANLQKANDNLKAEQGRLGIAQGNLDNANKALTDANNNLAQKKQAVENDKVTLKADNDKLAQLQSNLSDLQNAPKLLADAKQAIADAQKKLADAQSQLTNATNKLNDLKTTAAATQANLTTAQQKVTEAVKAQSDAQEALTQAKNELSALQQKEALAKQIAEQQAKLAAEKEAKDNGYHVENNNVVDSKGNNVQGWTVKNGQMIDPNNEVIEQAASETTNISVNNKGEVKPQVLADTKSNGDVRKQTKKTVAAVATTPVNQTREQYKQQLKSNNQLPQTGNDSNTILSLAGVAMVTMLGLFGIKKREY